MFYELYTSSEYKFDLFLKCINQIPEEKRKREQFLLRNAGVSVWMDNNYIHTIDFLQTINIPIKKNITTFTPQDPI